MTINGITIKWPVWALIIILVCVGAYFLAPRFYSGMGKVKKVGLNSWSGFAPEIKLNEGLLYNKESRNAKEFDLKVEFVQIEDRGTAIAALASKEVDAIWTTTDIMSTEVSQGSDLVKIGIAQILMIDRSNGADVIVGDRTIKNVMDAKGKKVAYTPASASHTLLLNWLGSAGLTMNDIISVPVASGMKAAEMFKSLDVPIAVVWSPDDGDCYAGVQGSHELFSTAKAKNIVMDGLIVRKEDLKDKEMHAFFVKLCKSWLVANAECNTSDQKKKEAAECFVKNFTGTNEAVVLDGLNKVRLSTYDDNKNFFGLNVTFKGVTGEDLYTRMANIYSTIKDEKGGHLANNPLPWRQVADESIIEEITDLKGDQSAEPDVVKFTPITPAMEKNLATTIPATAVKVTVNFAVNSYLLDDDAKTILDREVQPYVKAFSGYRIRVEGNTDKSGIAQQNVKLSFLRAKAVTDYLIETYKFDPNRFTKPIGWGSKNPIYPHEANEKERASNRRTEISFINE